MSPCGRKWVWSACPWTYIPICSIKAPHMWFKSNMISEVEQNIHGDCLAWQKRQIIPHASTLYMRDLVPGWKLYVQCWWEGAPHIHAPRGCQSLVPLVVTQKSDWRVFLQMHQAAGDGRICFGIHMSYACLCVGYHEESILGCHTHCHHICLQE